MKRFAVIVAGGSGTRMKSTVPKQFMPLCDRPVLMHTLEKFHSFDKNISLILVLPKTQIDAWRELCQRHNFCIEHQIVEGGQTRFHSVKNGLSAVADDSVVAVHDGVRPLVSPETLERCFAEAEAFGTAIPVCPATESVRLVDSEGASHAIDRSTVRMVQTPQVFRTEILKKSYNVDFIDSFTDDASVVEAAGVAVHLTDGNRENIKLTTPDDMIFAEVLLKQ